MNSSDSDTRTIANRASAGRYPRRRFAAWCAATAGAVAVAGKARAAQYSWKLGNPSPAQTPINERLGEAFAKVTAETDGQIEIKIFPNSTLGADPSMVSQLRLGALEMMADAGGEFDAVVPVASIENAPFAFSGFDNAWGAFDGDLGKVVRGEFYSKGLFAFERPYDNGFRQITNSIKPIRTVDDLQGLKIRVPNSKFRVDAFRSLGASPTPIGAGELYTALQTHVVDAQESPLIQIESGHRYEVQKFCSLSNHMWTSFWIVVNRDKWESLPRKVQDVMEKEITAYALPQREDNRKLEGSLRAQLTSQGMTFNDVNTAGFKERLRTTGFYARWREEWGAAAWNALEKYSGKLT